jgi:peroxiredoxin
VSDALVWVLLALAVLSAAVAWALLFALLRQHGGLLVRLDGLEERLAASGLDGFEDAGEPAGVAVGSPLPGFRLPDVNGTTAALEDFRGKRVLLVHWSPGCGFCDAIATDLAKRIDDLRKRNTELVLVSSGDADTNRTLAKEHGLDCPVLLQAGTKPVEAFAEIGTPAAYLIDEQGRVASGLVLGADKVPELLREALDGRRRLHSERPLNESRIERDGIKPGARAPAFALPAVDGGIVSLEDYRGRRVLIVFSDPQCGPCQELAPKLVELHDRAREAGVNLVMVSRGALDENRRKRGEHGIEFPVGVQRGWRLSKEYGIFASPVGFLVDEEGVIARPVAKGPDAIVALLRTEIGTREEAPLEV